MILFTKYHPSLNTIHNIIYIYLETIAFNANNNNDINILNPMIVSKCFCNNVAILLRLPSMYFK